MYVFILCVFAEMLCFGFLPVARVCWGEALVRGVEWNSAHGLFAIVCLFYMDMFCVVSWEM